MTSTLDAQRIGADRLVDRFDPRPVVTRETPYEGMVWNVRRDTVELGEAGTVRREYVEHPGAVVVLPYRERTDGTPEILVIQQYRHPIGTYEWELPAGLLDVEGEEPQVAAARELAEEVDLVAGRLDVLADFVSSPGGITEALRIYLARDLRDVSEADRFAREAEERDMPTHWVDLDVAREAVLTGRVGNAGLVVGVLAVVAARAEGWTSLRPVDTAWPQHPSGRYA